HETPSMNINDTTNRFARSPPMRIWGKFSNPTPIVEKATPNIVMKSRRGKVVEDPCPVGCDAISKRPRKSATHPTRTMRTPQTRNASSVMLGRVRSIPLVEGRENHLVSVGRSPRDRVPKAFMAYAANRPFRSRSLVRSRIGAFRASDAGSNPAGSMLFFDTIAFGRLTESPNRRVDSSCFPNDEGDGLSYWKERCRFPSRIGLLLDGSIEQTVSRSSSNVGGPLNEKPASPRRNRAHRA